MIKVYVHVHVKTKPDCLSGRESATSGPHELCYTDMVVALCTSDPGTNECGRRVQWNLSMCSSVPRDVLPPELVCYGRLSYKAFSCSASSPS